MPYRFWAFLLRPGPPRSTGKTVRELVTRFEALPRTRSRQRAARLLLARPPVISFRSPAYALTHPEGRVEAGRILVPPLQQALRRRSARRGRDGDYPSYYLRNFHWQSDGC
jgi:hypothetical protein